ncbi:MAG: Protein of unknown function rane [Firmicutes bacterium]|nr:Protein of unknown function rane [Bacillota bacterium]
MVYNNSRQVVAAGIMSAITVMLTLISMYIPILGALANLVLPLPIILTGVRHGLKWSIMVIVVAAIIAMFLMGPLNAVQIVVTFGLTGIVFGYAIRAKMSAGPMILWGAVAGLVSMGITIVLAAVVMGIDPLQMEFSVMEQSTSQVLDYYRSAGLDEQQVAMVETSMRAMIDTVRIIFPAFIAVGSVLMAYVTFILSRKIINRTGYNMAGLPAFKNWVLPPYVLYIFILGFIISYVGKYQQIEAAITIGENLKWCGISFTFVQGLSVFYYLADKYKLSRLMRGIILLLIFTNLVYQYILVFGGAFEIALDYRRLRKPRLS